MLKPLNFALALAAFLCSEGAIAHAQEQIRLDRDEYAALVLAQSDAVKLGFGGYGISVSLERRGPDITVIFDRFPLISGDKIYTPPFGAPGHVRYTVRSGQIVRRDAEK